MQTKSGASERLTERPVPRGDYNLEMEKNQNKFILNQLITNHIR